MAAPVPGADRQFIADPENASAATQMGDMATINLQMLHMLETVIPAGAMTNLAAQVTLRCQQVLEASKVSQSREAATRELRPLTKVPVAPWGITVNIAPIRMHSVPTFTGSSADTLDVVRWLSRIFTLAKAHTLTHDAAIGLLIQGSSGGAADYIEQMRDEAKDIFQMVQLLEMRYGDLCTPEEARVKTNSMLRKQGEGLSEFIDRLRSMARMASRLEGDDVIRRQAIESLVEGNIRRVLPTSVRNALGERVVTRSSMGLPAFTAREVEKECLDLERRRDERKAQMTSHAAGNAKQRGHVNHIQTNVSGDSDSSIDEVDIDDEGTYHLINEIKQVQRDYARRNKAVDPPKVYRKAFRNYNNKFQAKNQKGSQPHGARQVGAGGNAPGNSNPNQGPPNALEGQPRRTIFELLAMANVPVGSCLQCGQIGHILRSDKCALKDKALTDRPCAKCGTGLHSADDCLQVFQNKYVAKPQAVNLVNQQQDHLNGE